MGAAILRLPVVGLVLDGSRDLVIADANSNRRSDRMTKDAPGGDDAGRAYLRDEEQVRGEFRAASYEIWLALIRLLGQRWDDPTLARMMASRQVRNLGDLARLRCVPDGRPVPAGAVLDDLYSGVTSFGKTPGTVVERQLFRELAGEARSGRTAAEVTAAIEAFLRGYAADYERGELTWVDALYAMAAAGDPTVTWTLEVPPAHGADEDATVMLRIPVAALEAAGLLAGNPLILEPRSGGLWIGRAPGC